MFSGLALLFWLFACTSVATSMVAIVSAPLRQKWMGLVPLSMWISGDVLIGLNAGSDDLVPLLLFAQTLVVASSFVGVYLCWWGLKGGFGPRR